MLGPDLVADPTRTTPDVELLEALLDQGRTADAVGLLVPLHTADAAAAITELPPEHRAVVLANLEPDLAAEIVEDLPYDVVVRTFEDLDPEIAAAILKEAKTDTEADILQDIPEERAEAILARLDVAEAAIAREMLAYDEDSAGGLMGKEYVAIPPGLTSREAVRVLRSRRAEIREFPAGYIYVVDSHGKLRGVVGLRSLLLCDPDATIADLMNPQPVTVPPTMPGEELVKIFRRYHFIAIPVVHDDGRLLGIVTQEDALAFEKEESDEELLQISGIVTGEELREMPTLQRASRRLYWLSLKIVLNVAGAAVIAKYESTLAQMAAIAVLLPIVSDMGGSAGSQAVAVSIRELALDRVRPKEFLEVLGKEIAVGLFNGLVLGAIVALGAWIWKGSPMLAALAAIAVGFNTILAVSVGGLLPLVLRRFKFDPAIASLPLLTTITDFCGFLLTLSLASRWIDSF
ncbi:MAG: Magnesium transporter MgtE [Fimbriimonadales bacterium]|nr:Magnesium transporter MgtE [Fimbriimonadales bacterium]